MIIKKLIFTIALTIGLSFHFSAQIYKKTMMAGGSASINRSAGNGSSYNTSSVNLDAQFGYFFLNNLAIGTKFGYSRNGSHYNSWRISPFVRYYVWNIYAQVGFGYANTTLNTGSSETKFSGSSFGSELGYALFLNDNVAVEPAFYFNQGFSNGNTGSADYGFKVGFQIYFNR